jgi:hypothetical protein
MLAVTPERLREAADLARAVDSLPRERIRFQRRSNRLRISTSELADVALEIGLAQIRREHGVADDFG